MNVDCGRCVNTLASSLLSEGEDEAKCKVKINLKVKTLYKIGPAEFKTLNNLHLR